MPLAVALLVVLSALVHAVWNALLKRSRDPEHAVVGVITAAALTACLLAFLLRVQPPPRTSLGYCFAAGLFEAGYFVTLARALARAPLGPVYTIVRGGALVVVWPISLAFLGEPISPSRLLGTVIVAVGLAATGASERTSKAPTSFETVPRPSRPPASDAATRAGGFVFAMICAAFVGGYHLAYKVALSNGGRAEVVVAISLATASLVNVATLDRARRGRVLVAVRREPALIALTGFLATAGFLLFLLAMARAGAGVVLTLRNTSILFAQVLAFALGDKPRRLGVVGAALVTVGAVLLAR